MSPLHHAYREKRPVRPGQFLAFPLLDSRIRDLAGCTVRPVTFPARTILPSRKRRFLFGCRTPGRLIGDIRTDGHMIGPETFYEIVNMIQERNDVPRAAQKARYAADPDVASGIADSFNQLIALTAEVIIQGPGPWWLATTGRSDKRAASKGSLLAAVSYVDNDPQAIHLFDDGSARNH